ALPQQVAEAYEKFELQQAVMLPVELARRTNGYIDSTEPLRLAKDPARAARLDAVLHNSAKAIYTAMVCLLPVLPEKAAVALRQFNIEPDGKTTAELLAMPPQPGHTFGEATPLFPRPE